MRPNATPRLPRLTNDRGRYPFKQMKLRVFKCLDEIYAGACDGMTYEVRAHVFGSPRRCKGRGVIGHARSEALWGLKRVASAIADYHCGVPY